MIIIRLKGGLGNQMFQYALYCQLKAMGREVKIDDVNGFKTHAKGSDERKPELSRVFGITYDVASDKEIRDMTDSHMNLLSRIKRKLFGRHSLEIDEGDAGNFNPKILEIEDGYLIGYFQSDKYFPDINVREQLRREFHLTPEDIFTQEQTWDYMRRIHDGYAVSVHVRRGDYLNPETAATFGDICDCDYYRAAINAVREDHPNAKFYVFTNDKDWTTEHIDGESIIAVSTSDEAMEDAVDFYLMSHCNDNICANSSFSWWSAWMNEHDDKRVYVPSKWINTADLRDIYTDDMIKM